MPFVDLCSDDDYASIFYFTNTAYSNVSGFDESKATVILLHPFFLDSRWLENQLGDPRMYENYNLIAFDMRVSGRSTAKPSARHDNWVDAADLAFCHIKLQLPKCHILAHDNVAVSCALRFAFLFPELCATLTLCNVPSQMELRWVFGAYEEMLEQWCFPPDLETLEMAGKEAVRFMIGPDCDSDLLDEILAYWQITCPPRNRQRSLESVNVSLHRQCMAPDMYRDIRHPVLIIHGDRNDTSPLKFAEELKSRLTNTDAVLYILKGASGSLSTLQGNASIVTQVFTKFVGRQPHVPSIPIVNPDIRGRMSEALHKLADYTETKDASSIASRDPLSSLSFCTLPPEVIQKQEEQLIAYGKDLDSAFKPLGENGRPTRKYSERRDEHWFSGGKDGLSYAGQFGHSSKQKVEVSERPLPIPQSEPITDVAPHNRLRRANVGPSSVDKNVIRGSMAKVVSSNSSTSIGRLMK